MHQQLFRSFDSHIYDVVQAKMFPIVSRYGAANAGIRNSSFASRPLVKRGTFGAP